MTKKVVLSMTNGEQINFNNIDDLTIIDDAIMNQKTIHMMGEAVINTRHIIHARLEDK